MVSAVNNPTPQTISALLTKLSDPDPDFRFMSLNDLSQILASQKSDFLRQDYNTAARIVDAVIKTLDDQNGEVQNLAVKCIGPLAAKIQSNVVAPMLEKLTGIKLEHSVDASLPALALRSAISSLPKPVPGVAYSQEVLQTYQIISRVLVPRILGFSNNAAPAQAGGDGLFSKNSVPSAEAIDVLIEVVRCFGPLLQPLEVEKLQDVVVQVLEKPNTPAPTKKRAVVALAVLAPYLTSAVLSGLLQKIQTALSSQQLPSIMRRLYITILGSLARSIPHQLGTYLPELVPLVLSALSQEELETQLEAVSEGDDQLSIEFNEVREAALVALEAFLSSCGTEMRPFTDDIIAATLRYLKYDPNYAMDDDEDMDEEAEDDDDELEDDDDFDDDGDFDDGDDDSSWKVRRCAAKTLYTLISTRSVDLLEKGTLYQEVATPLIRRCDEREESVRLEVISTLSLLIRKTGEGVLRNTRTDEHEILLSSLPDSRKRRRQSSSGAALANKAPYGGAGVTSPKQEDVPESGPRADLARLTPQIVKTATKLLKGKQIATKQAMINLLDDLISVQHGGLSEYFDQVMQPIIEVSKGTTGSAGTASMVLSGGAASATATTLRVAVLNFISDIAKTHSSSLFQPYLPKIVAGVVSAVGDRFYKISSEAIRTAEELVKAITPPRARLTSQKFKGELQSLYDTIYGRAAASDADAEVRQKAIQALGTLLSRTSGPDGQSLLAAEKRQAGLELLLDRLRNETTRLHAVRAIDSVAAHTINGGSLDRRWIQQVAIELCGQLRKANRSLRGSSIQALQHLILSPASKNTLDSSTIDGIVNAILPVVAANDSHLLAPALNVLAQVQLENPNLIDKEDFVTSICELLKKSITGSALEALSALVTNVGQTGKGAQLMRGVLQVGVAGDPAVVGRVAGTLFVASNGSSGVTIDSFISELNNASKPPTPDTSRQSLALAILGEIGLRLGTKSPLKPDLFLGQFKDEPDKASVSAAVALGRAGAGNIATFMPVILDAMAKQNQQQYLLLQSIREVLHQVVVSSTDISAYEDQIWQILFTASQSEDNKAICAECIGRLAIHEPKTYILKLQELLKNESPAFRAVAVQALRYTLPDSDEAFDAVLKTVLVDMLLTVLQDQDMEIRRLAMTTLNSAAHNKPDLILPHLGQLVPFVMTESVIKPELIREVQMGPFKHKVDDGLEVRKSAYETLYALMETAFSRIASLEFYNRVIAGLSDDNDIRALCNLMLSKLIVIDPEETTRRLDTIAECYRKTLSTKLKDGAVKQEVEKQEEANKSVLRLSLLLAEKTKTTLPSSGTGGVVQNTQNAVWQSYWEWINKDFDRQLKMLRDESRDTNA
ncbi:TATA-binding protein interacting [Microdochium trichocladiopsis]|uniref:TATA-binding protein interacting n=1 Tax=Microdochium trichocladiopsis TaxID=1682393 RepID=A0A9P9BSA2_9PEZI|nr:TATA-binding protein interacting [Microdochium trichocladiopsis]KAH7033640.1 TATA-binding protein interacting [Microdochium trichocladiopsis]